MLKPGSDADVVATEVPFSTDITDDADADEIIADRGVEVVGLLVDSDVRSRRASLYADGLLDDENIGDVVAAIAEDGAVVLVEGDVTSATVELPTVDEDVEETDDTVLVVVVKGLAPAMADEVTVAVDAVEVTLAAAAEDADGVEVAEVTISADVTFTVDSRADADVDETADDMEVEVVDLRVDSDVRS